MTYGTDTLRGFASFDRGRSPRNAFSPLVPVVVALGVSVALATWKLQLFHAGVSNGESPAAAPAATGAYNPYGALAARTVEGAPAAVPTAITLPNPYGALPKSIFSSAPESLARSTLHGLSPDSTLSAPLTVVAVPEIAALPPKPAAPEPVEDVPVPKPRPAEPLPAPKDVPVRPASRPTLQQNRTSVAASPPDDRNFFERLFGVSRSSGPVPGYDRWTAVYDISAHTVYMPDGTKLEAHSGLGNRLDDPRSVTERDRGATPPHVYELEPRAEIFHGVQALRLNPVGGGDIFGRTGLLAHSYMLGPNGDSNGCVSFKNYDAFLQAYSRGQIKRLAVVARLS